MIVTDISPARWATLIDVLGMTTAPDRTRLVQMLEGDKPLGVIGAGSDSGQLLLVLMSMRKYRELVRTADVDIPLFVPVSLSDLAPEALSRLETFGMVDADGNPRCDISTVELAGWFRNRTYARARKDNDNLVLPENCPDTWAPASGVSRAHVAMAGDVGMCRHSTRDVRAIGNVYKWFDLDLVPVGGSVWRLSHNRTLWHFTRCSHGWSVLCVPHAYWPEPPSKCSNIGSRWSRKNGTGRSSETNCRNKGIIKIYGTSKRATSTSRWVGGVLPRLLRDSAFIK
ncbi:hypothetical protein HJC99_01605 [Candidatus Saccharibacteria bacterium]|nr:hypothetical protein [Candidatus Saccharibacteria bacterium]